MKYRTKEDIRLQNIEQKKTCVVCKKIVSYDGFFKNKRNQDGLSFRCKPCSSRVEEYINNREKILHQNRVVYHKNKDRKKQAQYRYKFKYGIGIDEYYKMVEEQGNKCLICETTGNKLQVDHCHETGIIRGLLCRKCNIAIGLFKESEKNILNALWYVSFYNRQKLKTA